ncbi:hypothetical protein ACOSQ2_027168 [Xanthoceras sorbifolium]
MLGYALHVEEAEKIGLDYMDVEALKDLQVWLAGISPPLGSTKVSARAARFVDFEVEIPYCFTALPLESSPYNLLRNVFYLSLRSFPAPSHWPCTYWPTQSSRACIRANPCV